VHSVGDERLPHTGHHAVDRSGPAEKSRGEAEVAGILPDLPQCAEEGDALIAESERLVKVALESARLCQLAERDRDADAVPGLPLKREALFIAGMAPSTSPVSWRAAASVVRALAVP
jgi:hypothetical protein